jgi:phospholipid/cholesterol/gamma-HCH transport system ATP-binding protein
MDAPADVLIRIRDLVVGFGEQTVLDHLSLDVRRGEILGVVGASGSGKSVLLRTVIGLVPKRHGSITIAGANSRAAGASAPPSLARRWGILFQQGALFSSLTVRQNIQFPLRENLRLSEELLDEIANGSQTRADQRSDGHTSDCGWRSRRLRARQSTHTF